MLLRLDIVKRFVEMHATGQDVFSNVAAMAQNGASLYKSPPANTQRPYPMTGLDPTRL
jgi:hypothetical protein